MKKNSGYMTRALQARDPRFAQVLARLGHSAPVDELPELTMDLKKGELIAIADDEGVELSEDDTKAEIIEKISAARA